MASLAGAARTSRQPGRDRAGAGLELVRASALGGLVRRASDRAASEPGTERILPVLPELRQLLPSNGLRRGTTIAIGTVSSGPSVGPSLKPGPGRVGVDGLGPAAGAVGATSLLLALLAAASRAGSWCAVVGVPTLGVTAAAEMGIALDRLALVPYPGPDWATVVAALLDGVDIVVTAVPGPVAASVSGRLAARARQRGSVLVSYGRLAGADLTLEAVRGVWQGLESGRGRLRCRQLTITAQGRGAAAIPKRVEVWLPKVSGVLAPVGARAPVDARAPVEVGRPALTVLSGPAGSRGSWTPGPVTESADDQDLGAVGTG